MEDILDKQNRRRREKKFQHRVDPRLLHQIFCLKTTTKIIKKCFLHSRGGGGGQKMGNECYHLAAQSLKIFFPITSVVLFFLFH